MLTEQDRKAMFAIFADHCPQPRSELLVTTPFELLVAVMLSAQSTDKAVNDATGPLFKVADSPEKMLTLGEDGIKLYIRKLGLFNSKARHLATSSAILVHEHAGKVPETREALEHLPGVGRKTANVILNTAFDWPVIAVDTHVFRVSNRTGLAPGKTPRQVEEKLYQMVPEQFLKHAHHWLILHGRYICRARKPLCETCLIRHLCCHMRSQA